MVKQKSGHYHPVRNWIVSPEIHILKPYPLPVLQNVTTFRHRAFQGVIKVKQGHYSGPYAMWLVSLQGEEVWTQTSQRKDYVKTQGGDGHRPAKEKRP